MKIVIDDKLIPGTKLLKKDMGGVTGLEFLSKVFFISDGVMLTQIRDVSGIDGSTLQNWTKRGWVAISKLKKYDIDQVAHILIINMLRSCMQLDKIAFLIKYINGDIEDTSDDIISDSRLYDYICRIVDKLGDLPEVDVEVTRKVIGEVTSDYVERLSGATLRLHNALEIITLAYFAAIIKKDSDTLVDKLIVENPWVEA